MTRSPRWDRGFANRAAAATVTGVPRTRCHPPRRRTATLIPRGPGVWQIPDPGDPEAVWAVMAVLRQLVSGFRVVQAGGGPLTLALDDHLAGLLCGTRPPDPTGPDRQWPAVALLAGADPGAVMDAGTDGLTSTAVGMRNTLLVGTGDPAVIERLCGDPAERRRGRIPLSPLVRALDPRLEPCWLNWYADIPYSGRPDLEGDSHVTVAALRGDPVGLGMLRDGDRRAVLAALRAADPRVEPCPGAVLVDDLALTVPPGRLGPAVCSALVDSMIRHRTLPDPDDPGTVHEVAGAPRGYPSPLTLVLAVAAVVNPTARAWLRAVPPTAWRAGSLDPWVVMALPPGWLPRRVRRRPVFWAQALLGPVTVDPLMRMAAARRDPSLLLSGPALWLRRLTGRLRDR